MSQGSLQLSVLSADGSLKGRMDVPSRQGHQTDNERWEWWWQEKKRDREKIAGVTASTCFPHLSDLQAPQRRGRKEKETHTYSAPLLYTTPYHRRLHKAVEVTVSSQCHVAASLFGSSQHTLILRYSPWSPVTKHALPFFMFQTNPINIKIIPFIITIIAFKQMAVCGSLCWPCFNSLTHQYKTPKHVLEGYKNVIASFLNQVIKNVCVM